MWEINPSGQVKFVSARNSTIFKLHFCFRSFFFFIIRQTTTSKSDLLTVCLTVVMTYYLSAFFFLCQRPSRGPGKRCKRPEKVCPETSSAPPLSSRSNPLHRCKKSVKDCGSVKYIQTNVSHLLCRRAATSPESLNCRLQYYNMLCEHTPFIMTCC